MKTKIFCDIAELELIKKFNKKKIVKGFTTNPSLMRKAGAKNYKSYSKKILQICNKKPVSLEVFGDNHDSMMDQALKINTWGKNVYVKVPVVNSRNQFTGKVIKELNNQKVQKEKIKKEAKNLPIEEPKIQNLEKDKIENKFLTPQQRGQALAEIITDLEIYSIKGILN